MDRVLSRPRGALPLLRLALAWLGLAFAWPAAAHAQHTTLLAPEAATAERLAACKAAGAVAVALRIELLAPPEVDDPARPLHRFAIVLEDGPLELAIARELFLAAGRVRGAGLELAWWIEVANQAAVAAGRPRFVAPGAAPWIPLTSVEGGRLHAAWLDALLHEPLPRAATWYVAALQEGPRACGCDELTCQSAPLDGARADGLRKAGPEAASLLIEQLRATLAAQPAAAGATPPAVVPVWVPGCESGHEVALGKHRCRRSCALQLRPLARASDALGLLLLAPQFGKAGASGDGAAWIDATLRQFATRLETPSLTPDRFVAIVAACGADGSSRDVKEVAAEVAAARAAGARAIVLAEVTLPLDR